MILIPESVLILYKQLERARWIVLFLQWSIYQSQEFWSSFKQRVLNLQGGDEIADWTSGKG